jgi:hypothetical protein
MTHSLHKASLLAFLLIASAVTASARTSPFEIVRGAQKYSGMVSYDVGKAYAGTNKLEVTLSIGTRDITNFEILKLEAPDQTQIHFTPSESDPSFDPATGVSTAEYKYFADISDKTEPRIYLITVTLRYPGENNITRTFDLYVGVRNKGKLSVIAETTTPAEFYTGTANDYELQLENNFPDFPVNVRSITVRSDPLGLIESTTLPFKDLSIDPLQRSRIELKLKTAPMSFTNLLSGFSDSTRMIVQVTYDDSFGRVITDLNYPIKVKVRPRDRILIIAMLVGVLIGAVIKLYLQRLQQQGIITRREVLVAVTITSLIGLVVSFIAVVGRIKIIAFDAMGSYDNPAVIFIIGLAGAVGGAQLLSTFFKSATGSTAPAAAPAPASPHAPRAAS